MIDVQIGNNVTMPENATPTVLAGRYLIVRKLGEGGMGSVWLAEDTKLDGRKVAIKMLPSILVCNKRAYAQVKAEALVSLKLSHPNIVSVRSFEEENGNPFLVMDYIDGQTLDDYLAEKGKLSEDETVKLLKPIAAALDYAHSQGVVHRDVKPGNVMIAKDGTPYILDFGIAREIQETMTRVTGKLSSGTLMYMSPEQLNGDAPKPAQDVYSFAAMVYECLKGEPPFSRGGIEDQIKHKTPDLLGEHIAICSQVMAGLAKAPTMRPSSCISVLIARIASKSCSALTERRIESADAMSILVHPRRIRRARIICMISLWLLLAIGLAVSFAVCRLTPIVYEAKSEVLLETGREGNEPYEEIFNTWLSDWRGERVLAKVVQQYRVNHPIATISDDEILGILGSSRLELVRNSHLITISVRAKVPELCAALANAYAEAIEAFTDEEIKIRVDKKVSQIHQNVERKRRDVDRIAADLLAFRTASKVDNLRSSKETAAQSLQATTTDILALESEETNLIELEKMLKQVQIDPSKYSNLSTDVPHAEEIATEFRAYQDADSKYQLMTMKFTDNHPEMKLAKSRLEQAKSRFVEAVGRALDAGRSMLQGNRGQVANLRKRQEDLRNVLSSLEQQIVLAESGLGRLEAEYGVANRVLEDLILDENKARIEAKSNKEIIRVGCLATSPRHPVSTKHAEIYVIGLSASLFLWVVFCFLVLSLARKNVIMVDDGRR